MEVKRTVVDDVTLLEVDLGDLSIAVGVVQDVSAVILSILANGPRKLCTGVDAAVEDISDGVTTLLTGKTSPENGSDIGVVLVLLENDRANGVNDQNGVAAVASDGANSLVSTTPNSKVVTVAEISTDLNECLAGIAVGENNGHVRAPSKLFNSVSTSCFIEVVGLQQHTLPIVLRS